MAKTWYLSQRGGTILPDLRPRNARAKAWYLSPLVPLDVSRSLAVLETPWQRLGICHNDSDWGSACLKDD